MDTFSSAGALATVDGARCAWVTGTVSVTCTVASLAVGSPVDVMLVVSTSTTFSGTLRNTADISLIGDVIDVHPENDVSTLSVEIRMPVAGEAFLVYLPLVLRE